MSDIALSLDPQTQFITVNDPTPTVSVLWDRAVQEAIVETAPGPTIGSRASALVHTAIYDAWAAFDRLAEPVSPAPEAPVPEEDGEAARIAAMSHAAWAVATELFPEQAAIFDAVMAGLGLSDPAAAPPAEGSPAAYGLAVAESLMEIRREDGSNQENGYADTTGYEPVNPSPSEIAEIERWTPENIPVDAMDGVPEQSFLTPQWGMVEPFALPGGAAFRPEPPEPFFAEGVEASLDLDARTVTLADGTVLAVSPDLVGSVINPDFVAQAERVVAASAELTDEQKLIAELWEDGSGTAFPPGTWMTFGQFVSAREDHTIAEDAAMFLALSNALLDAGIATWEAKVFYDYARPVRAIRELGELGLIGRDGTDEITGEEGTVIEAWGGPGEGTRTILAENFLTYQTPGLDPSPPFAEYVSGHSTFSAAAATVLAAFSGAPGEAFGGSVIFEPGSSRFEPGVTPAEPVTLSWDTFSEAADEAGISRIYGGIHFNDGDMNGRMLGGEVGRAVYTLVQRHLTGTADEEAPAEPAAPAETLEVARLYQLCLGRFADRAGLNFWDDVAAGEGGAVAVAEAFAASGEFARAFGPPDGLAAESLADRIVFHAGLDPEESGLDEALADRLSGGESLAEVLVAAAGAEEVRDALAYLDALAPLEDGEVWFA